MNGRGPVRHDDRARDYDRRRGPSPVRPMRGMRDERDRGHDRDRGYQREREADRYDRARDRGGLGRERSPVLKKARYGRSRSPGRRSSKSPGRGGVSRHRCETCSFSMTPLLTVDTIAATTVCICHLLLCAKSIPCTGVTAMHWPLENSKSKLSLKFSMAEFTAILCLAQTLYHTRLQRMVCKIHCCLVLYKACARQVLWRIHPC